MCQIFFYAYIPTQFLGYSTNPIMFCSHSGMIIHDFIINIDVRRYYYIFLLCYKN
ncbi:hypothetical protein KFK09_005943 [Dendrobium nobile]|uniref:Uncharacterized protein n=1 Tax=Dendrobium nobile TaxID=94219 RepID=A0A8T3C0M6_DENNO|nr:hypothetical protein KFK09_005943 [Dendrobium nobile]